MSETKVDFRIFDFPSLDFIPSNSFVGTKKISWSQRCKKCKFPRIFYQMARAAKFTNVGKVQKSVHFPCLFWLVSRHHCVCPARSASPFTHNGWKDLGYGAPRQKRRGVIRVSKRCKTFKNHWFYKVFQESGKNYASMASVYLHWS